MKEDSEERQEKCRQRTFQEILEMAGFLMETERKRKMEGNIQQREEIEEILEIISSVRQG
jgi:hypothetical protein